MKRKNTVLIIEDEAKIARFLQLELEHEGYVVDVAYDGKSGLDRYKNFGADIILLDLMLPVMGGFDVLKEIRAFSSVPVIMLTARDDTVDKVTGLDLGASDYVTKPFAIEELFARMRTQLAAKTDEKSSHYIVFNGVTLDDSLKEVSYNDEVIELTKKEYELLKYLFIHKNETLSRSDIVENVWGYEYLGDTNVVDVYIRYLRQKIDDKYGLKLISTVRGVGYCVKD